MKKKRERREGQNFQLGDTSRGTARRVGSMPAPRSQRDTQNLCGTWSWHGTRSWRGTQSWRGTRSSRGTWSQQDTQNLRGTRRRRGTQSRRGTPSWRGTWYRHGTQSQRGTRNLRGTRRRRGTRATSTGSLASQRHPGKFPKVPILWTLWEREGVGRFGRMALKHVKYHV